MIQETPTEPIVPTNNTYSTNKFRLTSTARLISITTQHPPDCSLFLLTLNTLSSSSIIINLNNNIITPCYSAASTAGRRAPSRRHLPIASSLAAAAAYPPMQKRSSSRHCSHCPQRRRRSCSHHYSTRVGSAASPQHRRCRPRPSCARPARCAGS